MLGIMFCGIARLVGRCVHRFAFGEIMVIVGTSHVAFPYLAPNTRHAWRRRPYRKRRSRWTNLRHCPRRKRQNAIIISIRSDFREYGFDGHPRE